MASNLEITRRLNEACMKKDLDTAVSLIHDDYTWIDPQVTVKGKEEFRRFMENCPSDSSVNNIQMYEAGDTVIQTMECACTKPVAFSFRMCDILTFKDGKVIKEETFYDTAQIPKEAMQGMQQNANKPKVA